MTIMSATQVTQPTERIRLAKYHLIVLTFFIFTLFAQYIPFLKYARFLPEDYQMLIKAAALTLYAVQSGFLISAIPLGVVFIFGWLYLMDVKVDVKRLYQIVVISTVPLLVLMVGLILHAALFLKLDPATAERLSELSQAIARDIQQNNPSPLHTEELTALIKGQQERLAKPMGYLGYAAVALCCLLCGYLLHRRLKLKAVIAWLIPAAFAGSVFILRIITTAGASPLADRLKDLLKP